ncbi:MotA/TolQ/ExbB proton channel family protein [Desertibacillus haloalkaliphilus]|uniref:MotA/TolQ/ExbB proton channel family protein n=1 Tax=Desertibacillus haloalkaliphilus TaxID=1328930 RepID=UPI001C260248|nr:MotA/TolQ/ExbB proton channel family protein [Desertibacillus haloalkaliphilus]MBU8907646.1 MotA/TolQ/ExbB proton channel family protein [Desertibacillus haloalkaliphilus]
MVEAILQLFISQEQAQSILSNPLIEFIFMVLFVTFIVAVIIHFTLYRKLRRVRNFINDTHSLDIDPVNRFQAEYEQKSQQESVKVETFVQNKFSSWRMFNLPIVSIIKMVQMTVSVFILVGVLGTFIGLAMSLGSINATGDQLVENVALVLAGIDVAFYTSITGMGLSLLMTVITKVANTEYMLTDIMLKTESHLEENEQDGMARLITVSETINASIVELRETNQESLQNIVQSFDGFKEYTAGLQQSAKDLAKFNDGLTENLKDFTVIFNRMKEVTNGFDQGVKKLNKNFEQLFAYFYNMDQRNERMASAFTETYRKIDELTTSQKETMNQFQTAVVDWKNYFASISEKQESIHGSFVRATAQSENLVSMMKTNNEQFARIFGGDLSSKLSGISTHLRGLKNDFDKLGNSIVRLPEALETIHTAQEEYKSLLSGRLEELQQFNQEFHDHLRAHARESQSFEKHLNAASRSYEQVGVKNHQMLTEINRTIADMKDSFNHRENQIESSVSVLKDTLSRYVSSLEGTLGDRLDKVSRNIGGYVVDINDAMKKEFKQIGEITEDQQQRSARFMQQTISELSQEIHTLNRQLQSLSQGAMSQPTRVRVGSND